MTFEDRETLTPDQTPPITTTIDPLRQLQEAHFVPRGHQGGWFGFEKGNPRDIDHVFGLKGREAIQEAIETGTPIPDFLLGGVKIVVNLKREGIGQALRLMTPVLQEEKDLVGTIWMGEELAGTGLPKIVLYTLSQDGSSVQLALRLSQALATLEERFRFEPSENDPYWAHQIEEGSPVWITQGEQNHKNTAYNLGTLHKRFVNGGSVFAGNEAEIARGYLKAKPEVETEIDGLMKAYDVESSDSPSRLFRLACLVWQKHHLRTLPKTQETNRKLSRVGERINHLLQHWKRSTFVERWDHAYEQENLERLVELVNSLPALVFAYVYPPDRADLGEVNGLRLRLLSIENDLDRAGLDVPTAALNKLYLSGAALSRLLYDKGIIDTPNFGSQQAFLNDGFYNELGNTLAIPRHKAGASEEDAFVARARYSLSLNNRPSELTMIERQNFHELHALALRLAASNAPLTLDDVDRINFLVTRGRYPPDYVDARPPEPGRRKFRDHEVRVAGKEMPSAASVPKLMTLWIHRVRQLLAAPNQDPHYPFLAAAQAHVELTDEIHPYSDGNGETARWLSFIIAHRLGKTGLCLIPSGWPEYLSSFKAKTKEEKIKALANVLAAASVENYFLRRESFR